MGQQLRCGHFLHGSCVVEMRRYGVSDRCPICRAPCSELTTVDELYYRACLCDSRLQFADEAILLDEMLTIDPSHVDAKNNLGRLLLAGLGVENNYGKAL